MTEPVNILAVESNVSRGRTPAVAVIDMIEPVIDYLITRPHWLGRYLKAHRMGRRVLGYPPPESLS